MVRQGPWLPVTAVSISWPPTPALIMCSDWTVNTNQTEARPLPNTETKALISQPLAINLVLKRIDQITQTINWKRFTTNWQYLTSFNFRHWPFLLIHRDADCHEVCQEDTSHIVYRWPGNSFCQDGNIPPDEWHVWGVWKVNIYIFIFISTFQWLKGPSEVLILFLWAGE